MKTRYKLTDQFLRTHNGFQWAPGVWAKTDGTGDLCGPGWLHCYASPLLAALLNPIHAKIENPRLWKCEVRGEVKTDRGLKEGWTEMRLTAEIALPEISTEQRVRFAILCAKQVYHDPGWNQWANGWLDGTDRAEAAAAAEEAAEAARADLNLKKIAKQACE
jgi:hypothetical protein